MRRRGKLRDVINATIGFDPLAAELGKPSKTLHRMLGQRGDPSTANFFAILLVLQKSAGLKLAVKAAGTTALLYAHGSEPLVL